MAFYCSQCKKHFIDYQYYESLLKIYPELPILFLELTEDGLYPDETNTLTTESVLKKYGYTVQEGKLSKQKRQEILKKIIDDKILRKESVVWYLNYFIQFNGSQDRMEKAVNKWQEDLDYVRSLNVENAIHRLTTISR